MIKNATEKPTAMQMFKGLIRNDTTGKIAYSSSAYYKTAAEALASAERTAEKKAAKYGRSYTAGVRHADGSIKKGRTFPA